MLNSFNLNSAVENQLGKANTIDPRAGNVFDKVIKEPATNVIGKLFSRETKPMLILENELNNVSSGNRHYAGSQVVAVKDIHGTIDRDGDFDYHFAPLKRNTEHRWCKVASAMLRGIDLPPIELVQIGDEYFVKDGHHRISVARALGFAYLDAIVEVWG